MQYLLLAVVIVMVSIQSVLAKQYDLLAKERNVFFFSAVTSFAALLFFVISAGFKFTFSSDYLLYSVGFGIAYVTCNVAGYYALAWGAMSITGLVTSYSLIIPTFYGLLALDEKLSTLGIVGIVCLFVSIFLINDSKEKATFSLKWVICLVIAFVGNGMCSTVQKMQQLACDGAYKNDFMIVALIIVTASALVMALIRKENIKEGIGLCTGLGVLKGVANGIVNLLVMVLAGLIPNAILFPSISAGGIVLGFVIAVAIYKERLSKQQLVGYVVGTVSVVLLNL